MELEGLKGQKLRELYFPEKFSFWGKTPKIPPKQSFLVFAKNLIPWCVFFPPESGE